MGSWLEPQPWDPILGNCKGFWSWMGAQSGMELPNSAWVAGGGVGVGEGVRPFSLSPLPTGRAGEGMLPLRSCSHQHSKCWWGHSPPCHALPCCSPLGETLRDPQPTFIGHLTGASPGVVFWGNK